jgi:hypothetical protein
VTWWVALLVALLGGLTWAFTLLGLAPADGPNGDVATARAGVCVLAGMAFATGLYVVLIAT